MAETIYQDFIHSVTLKRTSASAKRYDFSFGGSEDFAKHWRVSVDFEHGKTFVAKEDETILKQIDCALEDDVECRVSILVNDGLCKVYLGEENVADLVLALDGYEGGRIKTNLEESGLIHSNESMTSLTTLWGDIYCGPYEVKKVINLGDDNYRLSENEYTVSGGKLTISETYLKTLETNSEYKFRTVTSFADFDFYVATQEVGAQVTARAEKFYQGDNAQFELSEEATVYKVLIDQEEKAFAQNGTIVTVKANELKSLGSGDHQVKLFTANGRPEATFQLYEAVEVIPELPAPVSHVFFYIDIAIFASLIGGYLTFSILKKHAKQ